jgi:diguanylate cyclase (GGDEF)-like protein
LIEHAQIIERERLRESERSEILEMVLRNEPLGTVLDAIARLIGARCPGALCAILTKHPDGGHTVSGPELPDEWLAALRISQAVPTEAWERRLDPERCDQQPAWQTFTGSLNGSAPAMIHSLPVEGSPDGPAGALLLCYREISGPTGADLPGIEAGRGLVSLAMEQGRRHDDLYFEANRDELTGLPNRVFFDQRLNRALRATMVQDQGLAVISVDLDSFKQINSTWGRRAGDSLLHEIALRIKRALRPDDVLARIAGDEFAIILNGVGNTVEAKEVAERIRQAVCQPFVFEGREIEASATAGIAIFPGDGASAEELRRAASGASHETESGTHADTLTGNEALDRATIREELRCGLRHNHFVVHYQPKVDAGRRIVGFEALVRLDHPRRGLIPPTIFIPVAEESGLIVPLGAWVLEEVCRQVSQWRADGFGRNAVAVNVSPVQICRPDFAKSVADCLERYEVAAGDLELELTERLLISAAGVAQEQLQALRDLGVRLSIDDFGTGYSSLSYLHRLRVDAIKLDKSFVQSVDCDALAHRLVKAMIGVAQGLWLSVIAEGIETEGQCEALITAGCPLMQGYLFARPQPARELEDILRASAREAAASNSTTDTNDLLQIAASIGRAEGCPAGAVLDGSPVFAA